MANHRQRPWRVKWVGRTVAYATRIAADRAAREALASPVILTHRDRPEYRVIYSAGRGREQRLVAGKWWVDA